MGIDIRTNPAALSALTNLSFITSRVTRNIERLSTGYRINSAADGAADLVSSEKLRTQLRGFEVAQRNMQVGSSVLNIADNSLQLIYDNLQRMREIAVEASNSTTTDFSSYQNELNALRSQIDTLAQNTEFQNTELLDGTTTTFSIQIGPNAGDSLDIGSAFADARATSATGLNLTATLDNTNFNNTTQASAYITTLDSAFQTLNSRITNVGKFQNALSTQLSFAEVAFENLAAAEGSIRNVDVARETAELARNQIIQQIANAMLSQANNLPTLALQLLGG
jgi:flagellin